MPLTLISAQDAAYWAGRPVGTIWRWASEGRISRHGGRYDLHELPKAERDECTRELIAPGSTPPLPVGLRAA